MGVGAILTSDLFRLRTTLDEETQQDLDRQRILSMSDYLTVSEKEELFQINQRLWGLGLMGSSRDPLYAKFLRAWTEREQAVWREETSLSPDELKARDRLAAEIVQELAEEEST